MRKIITLILIGSGLMFICCKKEESRGFHLPEDYKSWKKPVDYVLDYPVPGHGQGARIIYANDITYQARAVGTGADKRIIIPEGAIIVKEVFKSKEDIGKVSPMLTIMYKDRESNMAKDGWLYYVKKPGSEEITFIAGGMCHKCHVAANESHIYFDKNEKELFRDFLFTPIVE